MNDEQFEKYLNYLNGIDERELSSILRARDTAQREALARVKAELHVVHDMVTMLEEHEWAEHAGKGPISEGLEYCITTMHNELHEANERADTAQAQLAEAVGLLRKAIAATHFSEISTLERDIPAFLARHAQAEQQEARSPMAKIAEGLRQKADGEWASHPSNPANQEAQGAQDGDERAAFERKVQDLAERFQPDYRRYGDEGEYKDATLEWAWNLWQARAALATQPAAGEPVAIANRGKCAFWVKWTDAAEGLYGPGIKLYTAPPAAAHGDEAVTNLVPGLQWAIDYCNAMLRQGNDRMLVEVIRTRLENVRDNQPTTMRDQGDGE